MGAEGGLEALSAPFPKLPGMLKGELHSQPFFLWKEMGSISLSSTPSPQPPAWYGQLSPRCGPGGEGEAGGQVEGTDEKGRCRAVANTKCHFLFVTLRYESSRGWVEVLR